MLTRIAPDLAFVGSALLATVLAYHLGAWDAEDRTRDACLAQEQARSAQHRQALQEASARIVHAEQQLQAQLTVLKQTHYQEIADAQARHDRLVAGLRAGAVRVSIPVAVPAACAAAAGGGPAAGHREARAELTPEAGAALAAIAHEGDTAILDLNRCVDAYAAARAAVTQER